MVNITLRPLEEGEKFRPDGKYTLIARVYHQDPAHPVYEIIDTPQPEAGYFLSEKYFSPLALSTFRNLLTAMANHVKSVDITVRKDHGDCHFRCSELQHIRCINAPPQTERDWSDVVEKIVSAEARCDKDRTYSRFREEVAKILQQADKRVPVKKIKKMYFNVYRHGLPEIFDTKEAADLVANARKRIACKEIEIEYYENEGIDG